MSSTQASRRAVVRIIAQTSYSEWPAYDSTPLYDQSSLGGLEEDIRTVAASWFANDAHDSVDEFVYHYPLAYFNFQPHDCYTGPTRYDISQLFRVFVLKELYGWEHETTLVEYLDQHPMLVRQFEFDSVPDQSTLWRSWHQRFTTEFRDTVETTAETILLIADRAGVSVPREPPDTHSHDLSEEAAADEQSVLDCAERITNHVT